jgi:hypothetical protein
MRRLETTRAFAHSGGYRDLQPVLGQRTMLKVYKMIFSQDRRCVLPAQRSKALASIFRLYKGRSRPGRRCRELLHDVDESLCCSLVTGAEGYGFSSPV